MLAAGYNTDLTRGQHGSTAEHLEVLEYKTKAENERLAVASVAVQQQEQNLNALREEEKKKKDRLADMDKKLAYARQDALTFDEIKRMGENITMFSGNVSLSPTDWKKLSGLAIEAVKNRAKIQDLKEDKAQLNKRVKEAEARLAAYEGKGIGDRVTYYQARQRAPNRMAETVADIMRRPPEISGQESRNPQRIITKTDTRQ
jgi:predicted  nucleic acid-binding Zn-ribbon protein